MDRISLLLNFALIIIFSNKETLFLVTLLGLWRSAATDSSGALCMLVLLYTTAIFFDKNAASHSTNGPHTSSAHRLLDAGSGPSTADPQRTGYSFEALWPLFI